MPAVKTSSEERKAMLEELADVMDQRAATYDFLSRLYREEVDQGLLDTMKTMRYPAATGNASIDEGYRLIATYLSGVWQNSVTELAVDYVRTFLGHGMDGYSAAYPFESVYTSEHRLLMQEARDEVMAVYREEGLEKEKSWKESEDHISLELEYMTILVRRCAGRLRAGDEDGAESYLVRQRSFLEDHLCSWVPMMTADMKKFAKTRLYQGLAFLTEGFLEVDQEFVEDAVEASEGRAGE